MAHIFETRITAGSLGVVDGVTRIACIGDSMMFGFGGPAREALPAHLSRLLNAAYPDRIVHCENFGGSSGNAWDAWAQFEPVVERTPYDAVVFSVCQNDMEMLGNYGAVYGSDRLKTFEDGTAQWEAGKRLLRAIVDWRAAHPACDVLIFFFTFAAGDAPMIARMSAACAELDLPFVDMLSFYRNETSLKNETYRVSQFDGHPSNFANELAARRLVREFRARQFLKSAPTIAGAPAEAFAGIARAAAQFGVDSLATLGWLVETAEAKLRTIRRSAGENAPQAMAWAAAEETARALMRRERQRLRGRARDALAVREAILLDAYAPNLHSHRARVEELGLLLRTTAQGDWPGVVQTLSGARAFATGFPPNVPPLAQAFADIRGRLAALLKATGLDAPRETALSALTPPIGVTADRGFEGQILRQIAQIQAVLPGALEAIEGAEGEAAAALGAVLARSCFDFLVYGERLAAHFDAVTPLTVGDGPPWTIVEVTVEGAVGADVRDKTFDLCVEFLYREPARGVIRERQLAGVLLPTYTYRFELPLMISGAMRVGLPNNGVNFALFESRQAKFVAIEATPMGWNGDKLEGAKSLRWTDDGQATTRVEIPGVVLS